MPRFFIASKKIIPKEIVALSREEGKHLQVLRLKAGEMITISNGEGDEFLAEIIKITTKESLLFIREKKERFHVPQKPLLILGQAIPRFSKMEFILQKGTELGINTIYPIKTERSYISTADLNPKRWERWNRILQEAGKQSGRSLFPELKKPLALNEFLKKPFHLKLLLWEAEKSQSIATVLKSFPKGPDTISILIGSEGGFTNDEAKRAKTAGYHLVSLGPWIMRAETASLAIVSILQYEWGDFNFKITKE